MEKWRNIKLCFKQELKITFKSQNLPFYLLNSSSKAPHVSSSLKKMKNERVLGTLCIFSSQ